MNPQTTLPGLEFPTSSRVSLRIEVTGDLNVSAFVARQKANRFLILEVGDQLRAGKPELIVHQVLGWRVPVEYAPSKSGTLGIVGHLLVDGETGEITIADGLTTEDLLSRADTLYERTAL